MAKILVVDDSIVMRKNLSTILTKSGHEVIGEAGNGRQAVAQYEALRPDLVTMDISMPIMSGVEAVQQIIELDSDARIIMISAVNQKKMVFNAINSGAKHYIIKPIDTQKVLSVVNEVLSEEDMSDKAESSNGNEQGFEINNYEGRFIIKFNKSLDTTDHNLLKMAVNGILFIKPLKVTFDFDSIDHVEESVLLPILELGDVIKENSGEVTYTAASEVLLMRLPK